MEHLAIVWHAICIQARKSKCAATNTSTCPVKVLQQQTSTIPVNHTAGPLFTASRFSPLSCNHVTDVLRCLLQVAGYDSHLYSSHSFHIGEATTSAAAGLSLG